MGRRFHSKTAYFANHFQNAWKNLRKIALFLSYRIGFWVRLDKMERIYGFFRLYGQAESLRSQLSITFIVPFFFVIIRAVDPFHVGFPVKDFVGEGTT